MNHAQSLVAIRSYIPDVILDIRYATTNNFTGAQLYDRPEALLCREPLDRLSHVAQALAGNEYKLVIFDAYRPPSVQLRLRAAFPNEDYVREVSNHCRGITVDLTLADAQGCYLDMGSDYDDFSEKSHPNSTSISDLQTTNRKLLAGVMWEQGFVQEPNEWWHFDYQPGLDWPIIENDNNTYRGK